MALKQVQPVMAFTAAHFDEDVSLDVLADVARLSPFHLHRKFVAVAGETPKQFTLRIRLSRAAAMLLSNRDESILNIALACGFQSHETFCRMFRRFFGVAPSTYRKQSKMHDANLASVHESNVAGTAPCLGLYRYHESPERSPMSYTITKRSLEPQHALVISKRVKQSEIAQAIGEVLPRVFMYAQAAGVAFSGPPITRYIQTGPGLMTIEPGMPVASLPASADPDAAEIMPITLAGGSVAMTTHVGPYDRLPDAYAAMEQWIEAEGLKIAGPPWESYITDPAHVPDPKDWKTEVFWPVSEG